MILHLEFLQPSLRQTRARILNYLDKLDYVHVFAQGKILKSGDSSLAGELEEKGYDWVLEEKSE